MITAERRRRWYHYYTEKRIVHQWFQVHLLEGLGVETVLEVGPNLGLVTAMLTNAGYDVTTLDIVPAELSNGASDHIQADLLELDPTRIRGFDCILCCETLEHLHWDRVGDVLDAFAASDARWLVLSVPYEGTQMGLYLYANAHMVRKRSFFKHLKFLKPFQISDPDAIDAHKWEVGYKGYSLKTLRDRVQEHGWTVARQDFTSGCRSVFLVCRNRAAANG
ncbi:MAG: methyltransferase domain-containing protein [Alphaproteobacteria bacterium]|nr:methyltransferase domain-containing protein [Alphaproteobacteria bacterium]